MLKVDLNNKVISVICSCTTLKQLTVAGNYSLLASKKFDNRAFVIDRYYSLCLTIGKVIRLKQVFNKSI